MEYLTPLSDGLGTDLGAAAAGGDLPAPRDHLRRLGWRRLRLPIRHVYAAGVHDEGVDSDEHPNARRFVPRPDLDGPGCSRGVGDRSAPGHPVRARRSAGNARERARAAAGQHGGSRHGPAAACDRGSGNRHVPGVHRPGRGCDGRFWTLLLYWSEKEAATIGLAHWQRTLKVAAATNPATDEGMGNLIRWLEVVIDLSVTVAG